MRRTLLLLSLGIIAGIAIVLGGLTYHFFNLSNQQVDTINGLENQIGDKDEELVELQSQLDEMQEIEERTFVDLTRGINIEYPATWELESDLELGNTGAGEAITWEITLSKDDSEVVFTRAYEVGVGASSTPLRDGEYEEIQGSGFTLVRFRNEDDTAWIFTKKAGEGEAEVYFDGFGKEGTTAVSAATAVFSGNDSDLEEAEQIILSATNR